MYLGKEELKRWYFFLKIRIALSFIKYVYKFSVDELIGDINITHEEPGKLFRTRLS